MPACLTDTTGSKARADGDEARAIAAIDGWIADQIRAQGDVQKFVWLQLMMWSAFEFMNSDPVGVMEREDEWRYIRPDEAALIEAASTEQPRFASPASLTAALARRRITEQSELSMGLTGVEAAQRILEAKAWQVVDYGIQVAARHGGLQVDVGTPIHAVMAERFVRRMIGLAAVSARPEVVAALPPPKAELGRMAAASASHQHSQQPSSSDQATINGPATMTQASVANPGERALSVVFEDWATDFLKGKGVDRHKTVDERRRNRGSPFRDDAYPKVGRNEPCPCGSGTKYKKCYGRS